MEELLSKIEGMVYTGIIPGLQLLESQMQKNARNETRPKRTSPPHQVWKRARKKFGNAPEKSLETHQKKSMKKCQKKSLETRQKKV